MVVRAVPDELSIPAAVARRDGRRRNGDEGRRQEGNNASEGVSSGPPRNRLMRTGPAVPVFAVLSRPPSSGGFGSEPWSSFLGLGGKGAASRDRDNNKSASGNRKGFHRAGKRRLSSKEPLEPLKTALGGLGTIAVSSVITGLPFIALRRGLRKETPLSLEGAQRPQIAAAPVDPEESQERQQLDEERQDRGIFSSATVHRRPEKISLHLGPPPQQGPAVAGPGSATTAATTGHHGSIEAVAAPPPPQSCNAFRSAAVMRKPADLRGTATRSPLIPPESPPSGPGTSSEADQEAQEDPPVPPEPSAEAGTAAASRAAPLKPTVSVRRPITVDLDLSARSADLSDLLTPAGPPPRRPEQSSSPEPEDAKVRGLEGSVAELQQQSELMEEELQVLAGRAAELQGELDQEKLARKAEEGRARDQSILCESLEEALAEARGREAALQDLQLRFGAAAQAAAGGVSRAEEESGRLLWLVEEELLCQERLYKASKASSSAASRDHAEAMDAAKSQVAWLERELEAARQYGNIMEAAVAKRAAGEAAALERAACVERDAEEERRRWEAEASDACASAEAAACLSAQLEQEAQGLAEALGREREESWRQQEQAGALHADLLERAAEAQSHAAALEGQLKDCGGQIEAAGTLLEAVEAEQGRLLALTQGAQLQQSAKHEEALRAQCRVHEEAEAALTAEINDLRTDLDRLREQEEGLQDMMAAMSAREWQHQARISVLEVETQSLAEQRDICESEARCAMSEAEEARRKAGSAEKRLSGAEAQLKSQLARAEHLKEELRRATTVSKSQRGPTLLRATTSATKALPAPEAAPRSRDPSAGARGRSEPCRSSRVPDRTSGSSSAPAGCSSSSRDPFDEACILPVTELGSMAATLFAVDSPKLGAGAREAAAASLLAQVASAQGEKGPLLQILKSLGGLQVLLRAAEPISGSEAAAAAVSAAGAKAGAGSRPSQTSSSSSSARLRRLALESLGHVAASPELCGDLVSRGGIPLLIRALGDRSITASRETSSLNRSTTTVEEREAAACVLCAMAAHPWCWQEMAAEGAVRCLVSALEPNRSEEASVVRACAIACSLLACDERALAVMQRAGGRWLLGATVRSRWVGDVARRAAACALERLERVEKRGAAATSSQDSPLTST